jgi:sodium-dependent dicarboxylate transporter 2/3/5
MKIPNWVKLISGPLAAFLMIMFLDLAPGKPEVTRMAAVTVWIALWWFTEVVDLAVTSLVPFVVLPLLGLVNLETVSRQYMDQVMFLFIGGFIIAFAVEKWGLHKRIALRILTSVGNSPSSILFGVMLTAYLISMWISNTATTMMLLSAVFSIISQLDEKVGEGKHKIAAALLLGLAYSATIGGMATPVGTPPNMAFFSFYKNNFAGAGELNFFSWAMFGLPVSILLLAACFLVLRYIVIGKHAHYTFDKSYFKQSYEALGKVTREEKIVSAVFFITALLWFTRADIPLGSFTFRGWAGLLHIEKAVQDSTVAIFMAILLFVIPAKGTENEKILVWDDVKKLPFDVILLFGSGFALAKGFEESGLSLWLAGHLAGLHNFHPLLILLVLCALITIISEFASNIACIQLVLPILVPMVGILGLHPLVLMIPATLAASLGFMLPVATAPNTIVFGSKRIKVNQMLKAGFFIDLAGILIIATVCYLMGLLYFG